MPDNVSFPRTVTGLVDEIRRGEQDAAVMAAAFADFARTIAPPSLPTGRYVNETTNGITRRRRAFARPVDVSETVLGAAHLAVQLSKALAAAPSILAALEPLTRAVPQVSWRTEPLYIPDDNDARLIRDAGTGQINPAFDGGLVPWFPMLPTAARKAGLSLTDVRPDTLRLIACQCEYYSGHVSRSQSNPWNELIAAAATTQLMRERYAGYNALANGIRGGAGVRGDSRRAIRNAANQYQAWVTFLTPLVDELAAQYGQYISTLTGALTALSATEGLDMPTLTTASTVIADLATRIRAAIDSGHGGRLVVSEQEQAFSWAPGPAVTLLSYLAQGTVTGRRTTVITAKDAVTVVGPVAEGGAKSMVVDFDSADVNLIKYPGQATITVESAQFAQNIESAVATVITGQIVRAIEADAAAAIDAATTSDIAAADLTSGVLSAIAQIRSNGGAPNVVALNAEDWVAMMGTQGASGFVNFSNPEAGPAGTWLGLAPVIVPGLVAGHAIVADGNSVTVAEPKGGPLCIVDPFTQAGNNKIVITIESWAVSSVTSPGGVATVAVTVTP